LSPIGKATHIFSNELQSSINGFRYHADTLYNFTMFKLLAFFALSLVLALVDAGRASVPHMNVTIHNSSLDGRGFSVVPGGRGMTT
jgi:preprotein translocase subunit SecG